MLSDIDRFSNEARQYILRFVSLMGYSVSGTEDGFSLKGNPNEKTLTMMKSNFYHFTNAIQNPEENIYQQLEIDIPQQASVVQHKSGIYDDQFITFQLPQIVMENQQSSLVWCLWNFSLFHWQCNSRQSVLSRSRKTY